MARVTIEDCLEQVPTRFGLIHLAAKRGMVKVSYGVHNLEAAIAGKSVSEVRQSLKEPLNIDPRALALVNSRDVAASYILKQGDQLEFVRLAGEKGGDRLARP